MSRIEEEEPVAQQGQPVFVHRFRSGANKPDDARCVCGQWTWREALTYWQQAPRWQVLRQNVRWCA